VTAATLRPNATASGSSGTVTGAASQHAATSDDLDTSYVSKAGLSIPVKLELGTVTKNTGELFKDLRVWIRASGQGAARCYIDFWIQHGAVRLGQGQANVAGTTPVTSYGPTTIPGDLVQASIDAFQLWAYVPVSGQQGRVYEAGVDVAIAVPPTVAITAMGTFTTSDVPMAWTHTPGDQGGDQSVFWAKVFTAAQVAGTGFNVATTPPVWDSGLTASPVTETTARGLSAGDYVAYVRTGQNIYSTTQYSAWDTETFDVDLTTAEVDDVTAAADSGTGRVEIIVDHDSGSDPATYYELQRNSDYSLVEDIGDFAVGSTVGIGWDALATAGTPTSTSASLQISGGFDGGRYQRIGGTFDNGDKYAVQTEDHYAISPSAAVRMVAALKGTLGANCVARLVVNVFDAADDYIESYWIDGAVAADWQFSAVEFIAPAAARYAQFAVEIAGTTGASAAVCTVDVDKVFASSGGFGWLDVRGATDVTAGATSTTFFDDEAAPARPLKYRARAVKAGPVMGRWVYSTQTTMWSMETGIWVKVPGNPALNVLGRLMEMPVKKRPQRRGIHPVSGTKWPVAVHEGRRSPVREFVFRTDTEAESDALEAAFEYPILLLHAPATYRIANGYWSMGDLEEVALVRYADGPWRVWKVEGTEVLAP
jgi:hypothetical protein